ncbi:cardiotrophin-2-like [Polyodon spathula]|uniref:cardiotrophin-2-like n=1 Tax=Polyodon spathula TaxID=7913 RepID=UPI001B7EE28B|nr:cardiotrophin-2-like [Polyodon spathula]
MTPLALFLCASASLLVPVASQDIFSNRESFSQCLALARKIHSDVYALLSKYKEEHIGSKSFEDYSLVMTSLPTINLHYSTWLSMEDSERLLINLKDLHVFWIHVDAKRIYELESMPQSSLAQNMEDVLLDMRDLLFQMKHQLEFLETPAPETLSQSVPDALLNPQNEWLSKLQGYIILRDLERYLGKVVRDFTLLRTKYQK